MSERTKRDLPKVVRCGLLIDGTASPPRKDVVLLIEGRTIREIGEEGEVHPPAGAEEIDASDMTVMPGLFDCHLHFFGMKSDNWVSWQLESPQAGLIRSIADARRLLEAGYTTVRDCAGMNGIYLRNAIEEGTISGPRILAAGPMISQTAGAGDIDYLPLQMVDYRQAPRDFQSFTLLCDGVGECKRTARYVLRLGADFIKICATGGVLSKGNRPDYVQFTRNEIRTFVEEASHTGKFVVSHAMGTEGIRNAIECGVRTVEHAWYPDDECISLAKERGTIFVPTLAWDRQIIEKGEEAGFSPWAVDKERDAWKDRMARIEKARRAGVTMASGTDFAGSPLTRMGSNAMELELLVRYGGFSPKEAIIAATSNAASACGLASKTGSLEAGKSADIIIVDGDPSRNVKILQEVERIRTVIKDGRVEVNRGTKKSSG